MTDTRRNRCKYCWHPNPNEGHNEGCPVIIATPEAMEKWKKGWLDGANEFPEERIRDYHYRHYNTTYILGYRDGVAEYERALDQADQERTGGSAYEY